MMPANEVEGIAEQVEGADVGDKTKEAIPNYGARSKFFYIS
jgi:hypothetical protein